MPRILKMPKRKQRRKAKGNAISRASKSKNNIVPFVPGSVKNADRDSVARWLNLADQMLTEEDKKRRGA